MNNERLIEIENEANEFLTSSDIIILELIDAIRVKNALLDKIMGETDERYSNNADDMNKALISIQELIENNKIKDGE